MMTATEHIGTADMPMRALGRTGERVSAVGLGGFHIGKQDDPNESVRLVRAALDAGITFLDNCWDYNDGESERRMGAALADGYRERAFLMTKIDGRDAATARAQIDESLRRLRTDRLDLLQFHEIIRFDDPDRIFAAGGAIEAAVAARDAGKVRHIGFTGHKSPDIHLKMLKVADAHGFHFDTVQMPLNVMDAHFESFERRVLPELVRREIGVIAMKTFGDPFIYETHALPPIDMLHYSLNLPVSVVVAGIDAPAILDQTLTAARTFRPLDAERVRAMLAATERFARDGAHERYKTSHHFDATMEHPEWLG